MIATKLNPPPARPTAVLRARLTALLDEWHPLTLISASPGFGKTTLLSEWLTKQTQLTVAWLSLDVNDNDPLCFLAYLAAALDRAIPGMGKAAQALMAAPRPVDQYIVVTTLINTLNNAPSAITLALDDYHIIYTQAVHDIVTFLLDHRPPQLRVCITTRADPCFND